jgi:hypothetical protein
MKRIVVNENVASRLKRFPSKVSICDEQGRAFCWIDRVAQPEDETLPEQTLSPPEIQQTLRDIFLNS